MQKKRNYYLFSAYNFTVDLYFKHYENATMYKPKKTNATG